MAVQSLHGRLEPPWQNLQQGGGQLLVLEHGLRLATANAHSQRYSNAQIDDYGRRARSQLPWRPPVRLTIRARFPTSIIGTAGFGFWNSPISPLGSLPALPAAIWFFYASPPSDMRPVLNQAGAGWKAACMDLTTTRAMALAPLAPVAIGLARQSHFAHLRNRLWRRIQHNLRIAEASLGALDPAWRTYQIEWHPTHARFLVDEQVVLEAPYAPRGPLGFVTWVDTQYLIATVDGQFGWGLLDVPQVQYFDIEFVRIDCF